MLRSASLLLVCLASSTALAQPAAPAGAPAPEPAAAPAPPPDANTATAAAPAPAPVEPASTSGLRNGFSLSASDEFGGDRDISAMLFGVDWRIGYRINEPISIYLHSHMSFGSGHEGNGMSGFTGTFASALMAEYLTPMRVFVAGGGSYGVLNNPNGPIVAARVGYYPFKADASAGKVRRLNVALDWRTYFASDGYGTVNHVALSIGYDRF